MMDGLTSLYVISALFGLFQGGLVPSYAIIVRERFPAREAGGRVGVIMMMTLLGMALGGWMSGAIFDLTGSYRAAFANGVAWNALNFLIALFLLYRSPLSASRWATAPAQGLQQDDAIEQDREVLHIVEVVAQFGPCIVDRGAVPVVDLRPAGQARLHHVALVV